MSARPAVRKGSDGTDRVPTSLGAHHVVRKYRLKVRRDGSDSFGVVIEEAFSGDGRTLTSLVVDASRAQTTRVLDAVVLAVKASGQPASALAFSDAAAITLDEAPGVRLALTLFVTMPVSKSGRIRAMVAGVNAMSVEEAYYWYSKCVGRESARARRALRTLLADE